MSMSKKDYEAIALVINNQHSFIGYAVDYNLVKNIANQLANSFMMDNPRFNKEKFMKACGF